MKKKLKKLIKRLEADAEVAWSSEAKHRKRGQLTFAEWFVGQATAYDYIIELLKDL